MAQNGEAILGSLYVYAPNKGAPIFFIIVFAISAITHLWQCYRYKSWRTMGLHPLCAFLFALGYAIREYGADNYMFDPNNKTPLIMFILSQICILICPPFLELANYHLLGRVFYYVPYAAPLPPSRVTSFFGGLMVVIEGLNAAGASLTSNANAKEATKKAGHNLILVALALQILVILVFAFLSITFHRRCIKSRFPMQARAVRSTLITLYMSMTLIFVRCLYRLVENATGTTSVDLRNIEALRRLSPLLRYEVFFYIFEASLMLVNSALWNVRHPGRYLPQDHHIYLAQDGTEVEADEEPSDRRPFVLNMANTLFCGMLFRDKKTGPHAQFQELDDHLHVNGHKRPTLA
ncbi:RTA1 domain-containing protein [Diaporthe amygdali]|uniref:RTA1 domain-containing protein n=1 Tax=Phomopsis amygdali TaxID=1214568 RepID=UPI0022FE1835|nr:RTA1 domain-containing protein [Diaporthe amygdali]KAJ0121935.1 RTA1 domain-containing protein [Diaporthe amygdali]